MAFVTQKFMCNLTLAGADGKRMVRKFHLQATTLDAAAALALNLVQRYGLVSDARLEKYTVEKIFVDDAFTLPAVADTKTQAAFSVQIAGHPGKRANVTIPAPKSTIFQAATGDGANVVNFEKEEVGWFLDMFVLGAHAFVSDGETINKATATGRRVHKDG